MTTAVTVRPTLILVPGLLCDDTIWSAQVAAFAATYDVIVPVLNGFDSIPRMATALLERAPARFALAGHSLGGRIALETIRQAPSHVTGLALLDTGVHAATPDEPRRRQTLLSLADAQGMHAVARAWLPPMVHPARHGDPTVMDPLEAMVERRSPAGFRNQIRALLARPDATPVLATIRCPTLVLCGREDGWSPLAQHQDIAAAIRGSTLAVIDECGHMAPFERPAEVTRALARWLAVTGTGA
jgi:pimeloyl-ACP methyl ester carboxylesterase